MKRFLLLFALAITSNYSFAQMTPDEEVTLLKKEISDLKKQIGNQRSVSLNQQRKLNTLQSDFGKSKILFDSLQSQVGTLSSSLSSVEAKFGADITKTNQKVDENSANLKESISSKSLLGIIIAFAIAILAGSGLFLLRKKVSNSDAAINAVKDAQKKLEEESIKLDNQLVDILNIQLKHQPTLPQQVQSQQSTPDHSLVRKVADEIVRIELNLSRMDPSIKGYKQLSKGIERIKDNFKAKGYEITDMLGKPYVEGMKAVVSFVSDETLPEGSQIITGIIKPQIIYNGTMIQSAEITVSQNN